MRREEQAASVGGEGGRVGEWERGGEREGCDRLTWGGMEGDEASPRGVQS